jgi:hypothetical protein
MQHASWLFIAVISVRQTSEQQPTYNQVVLMVIPPTDIQIQICYRLFYRIDYFQNIQSDIYIIIKSKT